MGAAICVAFSLALVAGGGGAGSGGEQALTVPGGPGRFPPGLLGNESLPVGFQKPGRKRAGGCLLHPSLLLQPAQLLELRLPFYSATKRHFQKFLEHLLNITFTQCLKGYSAFLEHCSIFSCGKESKFVLIRTSMAQVNSNPQKRKEKKKREKVSYFGI